MNIDELVLKIGATHYSPAPMRAVKGWSFTFEQLQALIAEYEMAAGSEPVGLDSFVQSVPEHCDRVIWRNSYYALPIRPDPRVAELKQENAQLRFALADTEALELGTAERLALAQADNQRLREAGNELALALHKNDFLLPINKFLEALATPLDTSALEAIVQKAGEVMRERCKSMQRYQGGCNLDLIRALPGVTLEDLK